MERPTPKHEIVIRPYHDAPHCMNVYAYSDDAWEWIQREAPQFGELRPSILDVVGQIAGRGSRILPHGQHEAELRVDFCYDAYEVGAYLTKGYAKQSDGAS